MKRIPIYSESHPDRFFAIVDDDDYEALRDYPWTLLRGVTTDYAHRVENGRAIPMHRQIMGCPRGLVVDHANGFGLDNRRGNLESVTRGENARRAALAREYRTGEHAP